LTVMSFAGVVLIRTGATPSKGTESQRIYESALAVLALDAKQFHPLAPNVFTLGPDAKRSCLVFAKVLTGLLRCARCGRKLLVAYRGRGATAPFLGAHNLQRGI
jgi:hypothetical protein